MALVEPHKISEFYNFGFNLKIIFFTIKFFLNDFLKLPCAIQAL